MHLTYEDDDDFCSSPSPPRSPSEVQVVLLVGVTNTLGPYVLRELLKRPSILKVVCLLPPHPSQDPERRLLRILEAKKLLKHIPLTRIETLLGDATQRHFGLDPSLYDKLAGRIHAVFNLAEKVSLLEKYRETEDIRSSRVVNVFGLRSILEFAVERVVKYVYHASTFTAETQIDDDENVFWEGWPSYEEVAQLPNSAYPISKIICDSLVAQAVERGIPCKVFRFPYVGGDSVRGGCFQLNNFLMMRLYTYMHLGFMPNIRLPLSILPVDQCAKFSVDLFFHDYEGNEMYNVLNLHIADEGNFAKLASEFGVQIVRVEMEEFTQRLHRMDKMDKLVQLAKMGTASFFDSYYRRTMGDQVPVYTSWLNGNERIFWSKKLEKLLPEHYPGTITPSWDILRRDLKHAQNMGLFERYKIPYRCGDGGCVFMDEGMIKIDEFYTF